MKLGTILANIADTEGKTQAQWKAEFLRRIKGHTEEKLLRECYVAATARRKYISFGRNTVPPKSLQDEGFTLKPTMCGFVYHFE